MEKMKFAPPKPRIVEIVRSCYQPSKEELEQDVRVDSPFEEVEEALV